MHDYELSSKHLEVIDALSSGANVTAAAAQAGVHRNTIHNWRRNLPAFQYALQHNPSARRQQQLVSLMQHARQALQDLATNPKTPPTIRLKAQKLLTQIHRRAPLS